MQLLLDGTNTASEYRLGRKRRLTFVDSGVGRSGKRERSPRTRCGLPKADAHGQTKTIMLDPTCKIHVKTGLRHIGGIENLNKQPQH